MKLNLEKLGKKNICLIGLMGSGKSVIGKLLANELRMRYYDSDKLIEKRLKITADSADKITKKLCFFNL